MPFFQMKKIKNTAKMVWLLLLVLIVSGCVAPKSGNVQTAETAASKSTPAADAAVEARQLISVTSVQRGERIEIDIQGNQKLVYTSIKQSFPFGIAIYFPETKLSDDFKMTLPEMKGIGDLTAGYADENKTIAKLEILLKKDLTYEALEKGNILKVSLFGVGVISDTIVGEEDITLSTGGSQNVSKENRGNNSTQKTMVSKTTAALKNIEFNILEDGKSDIAVYTDRPVSYSVTSGGDNKLYLNLNNTYIPQSHRRPLLTHYFKSAVERLVPVMVPGKKNNARIEIKIRDRVPYRVVQDQNKVSLFFEPSGVEPPVFHKAEKKVVSGSQTGVATGQQQSIQEPLELSPVDKEEKSLEEEIFGKKKVYTGEKIKLDFYESDIKNVFRILRSVGGLNFAIDKDVEGKVTLTLEDPVPWDQVLDLVLKMNNLGQKKEGNVIRIATLSTLKKEEGLVQDAITARKKAIEQKKSLEPLITEYIPINYSDATADIKPHIDQILTGERGKVSVDKRTNMVIVTDTQAKIQQIKEIIFRLDKVTPQIMIEAKVVEVTKNFSRELGIGLSLTNEESTETSDFSVALNHPIASPVNTGSLNFYRLFGSSLTSLNAQISASESKGDVKVISSPRILTLDNNSAKIKQGLEYAYLERDSSGGSSVKFKNIDLLLEVTPHVTPDKRISMKVYLTKNDIDSVTSGVPSLSTNEAQTELLVNNNDTIVIGGIVKTTENKSTSGMPYLSNIPIIGRLFRTDIDTDKRNELLIFLTPSIVQLEQKRNDFPSD